MLEKISGKGSHWIALIMGSYKYPEKYWKNVVWIEYPFWRHVLVKTWRPVWYLILFDIYNISYINFAFFGEKISATDSSNKVYIHYNGY